MRTFVIEHPIRVLEVIIFYIIFLVLREKEKLYDFGEFKSRNLRKSRKNLFEEIR